MLTISAEIKKDGKRLDGTYNVKLRFTLGRKVRRKSTSLFALPKDLTKDFKIKQISPLKPKVDDLVKGYQEKCAKLQIELNHYTLDDVMDYLNGEHEKEQMVDFIKFSREWIASTSIKGAPNYTTAINALIRFVGKEKDSFLRFLSPLKTYIYVEFFLYLAWSSFLSTQRNLQ